MTKNTTKRALLLSVMALVLCFTMLLGTTFAWFTDSVTSGKNTIVAGNLDIELEYSKTMADGSWKTVKDATDLFDAAALWEPGHAEVVYLKISNLGTLALKYKFAMNIANEITSTNINGGTLKLSEHLKYAVVDVTAAFADRAAAVAAAEPTAAALANYSVEGEMLKDAAAKTVALVVYMPETVGNEANYAKDAAIPTIELGVSVVATQLVKESDSFGDDYDFDATYPVTSNDEFAAAIEEITSATSGVDSAMIALTDGNYETNFKIPGGKEVVLEGNGEDTVISGQIATTASNEGTLVLRNLTVNVSDAIADSTGISQTGKSAIAIWGDQTVICENVIFEMDETYANSTAITSWWDTGVGTTIIVRDCTFNCNGQRPIRATGNVTVENTVFNDPYRYAVQLTAKASTATLLDKAVINFNNNTINNGENGKDFVYGVQLEGADYGCNDMILNGTGNTIVAGTWDTANESAMYFCECGKVNHSTVEFNTEVAVQHEKYNVVSEGVLQDKTSGSYTATSTEALSDVAELIAADNTVTSVSLETENGTVEVPVVSDLSSLNSAIAGGDEVVVLREGTYNVPSVASGKEIDIVGTEDTVISITNTNTAAGGSTLNFTGVTIQGQSTGNYAGMGNGTKANYVDCTFNGKVTLYGATTFTNCEFNNTSDYAVWTWGASTAEFTKCTFNSAGKALLVYANVLDNGTTHQTVKITDCTFNDSGDLQKAAIEVGDDYGRSYDIIITETTVNGFAVTEQKNPNYGGTNLGTNVWGNKNLMTADKLNVFIDGVEVY